MRWHVSVILFVVILSFIGFGIILIKQDPFKASILVKSLFFSSSFIFFWGLGTLILLVFKNEFSEAFRRGFFISIVLSGTVVLNRLRLLSILNFSLLLGIMAVIEGVLIKVIKSHKKDEESWT